MTPFSFFPGVFFTFFLIHSLHLCQTLNVFFKENVQSLSSNNCGICKIISIFFDFSSYNNFQYANLHGKMFIQSSLSKVMLNSKLQMEWLSATDFFKYKCSICQSLNKHSYSKLLNSVLIFHTRSARNMFWFFLPHLCIYTTWDK